MILMSIFEDFYIMIDKIREKYKIPIIKHIYLPPFFKEGQPKEHEFMALSLTDGSVGLSFILNAIISEKVYSDINKVEYIGKDPVELAKFFGSSNGIEHMIALASINAISQHIMKETNFPRDYTTDSLGLLDVKKGDRVGMIGFFKPLIGKVETVGAKLVVIEKNKKYIGKFPKLHVTMDPTELVSCNNVLCTSTTILNNTLDDILNNCKNAEKFSIIGPTAGYFPDPLFKRGVTVVGGTYIPNDTEFFNKIESGQRWGSTAQKYCFQKENYKGINSIL